MIDRQFFWIWMVPTGILVVSALSYALYLALVSKEFNHPEEGHVARMQSQQGKRRERTAVRKKGRNRR